LEERIKEGALILAGTAGSNPIEDARMSGCLTAYTNILNIEAEDL